jgi:ABC-type Fe3+-siderophore transport system permease subunit
MRRVRLSRCADATGKGRAIVLCFFTIVNVFDNKMGQPFTVNLNNLARALTATVSIFDSGMAMTFVLITTQFIVASQLVMIARVGTEPASWLGQHMARMPRR